MKKKSKALLAALLFSLLPVSLFSNCDKDTNCYLDVKVVDSDTKKPIPFALVEVYQDGGTVYSIGSTGGNGVYSTHFVAPAIVQIRAKLDSVNANGVRVGERRATGAVRLIEGETATATLSMTSQVFYQ